MNIGRKFFSKKTLFLAAFLGIFLFLPSGSQAQLSAYNDTERACIEKPDPDLIALQIPIIGCDAAQETAGEICCSTDKVYTIGVKDAPNYVVTFFRFAIIFLAIFLVILIMIGGVMYLASGGSPDYITKAKGLISKSAISMVLLLFSVVLLNQINPALIKLEVKGIVTIEAVKCCQIGGAVKAVKPEAGTPIELTDKSGKKYMVIPGSDIAYTNGHWNGSYQVLYPNFPATFKRDGTNCITTIISASGTTTTPRAANGYGACDFPFEEILIPTQLQAKAAADAKVSYVYQSADASGKLACPAGGVPIDDESQCLAANSESEEDVGNPLVDETQLGTIGGDNIDIKASDPRTLKANIPLIVNAAATVKPQIKLLVTSGFRSFAKQQALITANCPPAKGLTWSTPHRSSDCDKPTALNGSAHNSGKAVDVWGEQNGLQCISQDKCSTGRGYDAATDPCRKNACQNAVIAAMKAQGFCNLDIEAWHFEKPQVSTGCH